jgi:ketosteroid isomerase-like protein
MKRLLFVVAMLNVLAVRAQSADEKQIIAQSQLLTHIVFGSTKDSSTLDDLFAKTATYGHSHGNVQTREQAISGILHNQSTYTNASVSNISVIFGREDVSIVRFLFKATENTKDGKVVPLNLNIMLVWIKDNGKWKLFGRQAVAVQ